MKKLLTALFMIGLFSACGPSPSAGTSPGPAASPTLPPGFASVAVTGGSVTDSSVSNVTIERGTGYDRFVIEFGGGVPSYSVTPQASAIFTRSPKGDQVTLDGTAGVLIVVHSINNWTSYAGPTQFQPQYPCLRQALQVENFEGYQQWAIGVQGTPYLRVSTLTSPSRLVVDIATI